jgi:RNA polymerase sigma-70 factor (ECF subfamily)
MKARTNDEWLTALRSGGQEQTVVLSELRAYLVRAALYTLYRSRSSLRGAPTDIEQLAQDCAQDALSGIVDHLHQFRGASGFTTWAYKFAVNTALGAARRERWAGVSLDRLLEGPAVAERLGSFSDASPDPERRALQEEILAAVRQGIESRLTPRQRQALIAIVFEQVPLDELARHWGSNRNALYKLLHDARRKLKAHVTERGFAVKDVFDVFSSDR